MENTRIKAPERGLFLVEMLHRRGPAALAGTRVTNLWKKYRKNLKKVLDKMYLVCYYMQALRAEAQRTK